MKQAWLIQSLTGINIHVALDTLCSYFINRVQKIVLLSMIAMVDLVYYRLIYYRIDKEQIALVGSAFNIYVIN